MRFRTPLRAVLALPLLAGALAVMSPAGVQRSHAQACTLCAGGEYQPLPTPVRIYDSRPGSAVNEPAPSAHGIASPPQEFDIQLLGTPQFDVPASDVLAVVVNITVTEPTALGFLSAYPKDGKPNNLSSIVNFFPGQTVPNMAIVRAGTDGKLTIALGSDRSGAAHVVVDVFGYFSTSSGTVPPGVGGRLVTWDPVRLVDTRVDGGTPGPGGDLAVKIRGNAANVPDSTDITAAVVNITGVYPTAPTFISAIPAAATGTAPSTSNLNLLPGQVKPILAIAPVGPDGYIHLYNANGSTPLVVDLFGVIQKNYDAAAAAETRAGRVVPLAAPFRAFDTREMGGPLGPGQAEDWSFANFANSITINGSAGAQPLGPQAAVLGNLTEATLSRQYPTVPAASFLTVWPPNASSTPPLISNLNFSEGQIVPNMALMRYDPNAVVRVYNFRGFVDYLFDASAVVLS